MTTPNLYQVKEMYYYRLTTGRYGKRYEIAKMKATIDSLKYEGVEFVGLTEFQQEFVK